MFCSKRLGDENQGKMMTHSESRKDMEKPYGDSMEILVWMKLFLENWKRIKSDSETDDIITS